MQGMAAVVMPQIAEKVGTYSAADLVTILAAVGVLFASIVTGVVTIIGTLRNGQKADRLSTAVIGDETHPGLAGQLANVEHLTNSTMTAANNKIDKLQEMLQELRSERNKKELAEAKAAPAAPAKPVETTVNMEVAEMNVEELNAPGKEEKKS